MTKATDTFRTNPDLHKYAAAGDVKHRDGPGSYEKQVLARFANCGAGRAEGGVCGALYAALAVRPDAADEVTRRFKEKTQGYTTCLEIKRLSGVPCPVCVQAADDILASLSGETE